MFECKSPMMNSSGIPDQLALSERVRSTTDVGEEGRGPLSVGVGQRWVQVDLPRMDGEPLLQC